MDPQMKRGMIDACVLSVLCRGESHGYKIIKDLSACMEVSESTLYPVLRRLETAGMLNVHSVEYNGRLRKMYSITYLGKAHLDEFLANEDEILGIYKFVRRQRDE
ncbi:MAG: PadR family transcriptional regulator [Bacillota bacterium]|nr:PadR family transcriptional regulator [Bacillota bacterium]